MKHLYRLLLAVASAAFFVVSAQAQNPGSVTNHAFVIGKGAGTTGYTSLLCGSAQLAVGQSAADPICRTLTGDVTLSAAGVTAIGTAKVTSAMLRDSAALSVIGRSANSSGVPGDIACSAGSDAVLRESGNTLGCGTVATAGIANNAVTDAKLRQSGALSLVGRSANSTGNVADVSASAGSSCAFRESSNTIACGTLATAAYANNSVTDGKLRQSSGLSLIGRSANSTGDVADITAASDNQVFRRSGTAIGFGSIDLSQSNTVGSSVLGLANGGTGRTSALTARDSSGLNIDQAGSTGDANGTIAATDRSYYHTALSAARTDTLPAANAVNAGQVLRIIDPRGVATASNTVTVQRAGSDTVNGTTTFVAIQAANGMAECISDGSSRWNCAQLGGGGGGSGSVTSVACAEGALCTTITTTGTVKTAFSRHFMLGGM